MTRKILLCTTALLGSFPVFTPNKADAASPTASVSVQVSGSANPVSVVDATGKSCSLSIIPCGNSPAQAAASKGLEKREQVTYLGVAPEPVSAELRDQLSLKRGEGILVGAIVADSPAARVGVRPHDVLLRFDDQILIEPGQLKALVQMRNPGDKVKLILMRKGAQQTLEVTLGQTEEGRDEPCFPVIELKSDGVEKLLHGLKSIPGAVVSQKAIVIGPDGKPRTLEDKDLDKVLELVRKNLGQGADNGNLESLLKGLLQTGTGSNDMHPAAP